MSTNYLKTIGGNKRGELEDRADFDFYATDPMAVKMLLNLEKFNKDIWEPCCGELHISDTLKEYGYNVRNSDLIVRQPGIEQLDFLESNEIWNGDIITNPPYKNACQFIRKALESVKNGSKIAIFLKLQFLEGKERGRLYCEYPPKTVYVSRSRLKCGKNGDFEDGKSSAIAFCWIIWEKGYRGVPELKWFN